MFFNIFIRLEVFAVFVARFCSRGARALALRLPLFGPADLGAFSFVRTRPLATPPFELLICEPVRPSHSSNDSVILGARDLNPPADSSHIEIGLARGSLMGFFLFHIS